MKQPFYLFLSVDLVGSTSYKARVDSTEWVHEMMGEFYTKLRKQLVEEFSKYGLELKVWKFLGDEILFYLNLKKNEDIKNTIDSIASVSNKSRASFFEKKLDIKFGIWMANIEKIDVKLERIEDLGKGTIVDFIGPNVDTGFRLLKFASPHRLVIDINIASFLRNYYGESSFSRDIYFEGLHELKGVLGGAPYPVFWIKLANKQENLELSISQKEKIRASDFKEYVQVFCNKNCQVMFEAITKFKDL